MLSSPAQFTNQHLTPKSQPLHSHSRFRQPRNRSVAAIIRNTRTAQFPSPSLWYSPQSQSNPIPPHISYFSCLHRLIRFLWSRGGLPLPKCRPASLGAAQKKSGHLLRSRSHCSCLCPPFTAIGNESIWGQCQRPYCTCKNFLMPQSILRACRSRKKNGLHVYRPSVRSSTEKEAEQSSKKPLLLAKGMRAEVPY